MDRIRGTSVRNREGPEHPHWGGVGWGGWTGGPGGGAAASGYLPRQATTVRGGRQKRLLPARSRGCNAGGGRRLT